MPEVPVSETMKALLRVTHSIALHHRFGNEVFVKVLIKAARTLAAKLTLEELA